MSPGFNFARVLSMEGVPSSIPRVFAFNVPIWGSLGAFCFTEGLLLEPPQRSKMNIFGARFFFIASVIIVAQIVYYIVTGRVAGNAA